MLGAVLCLVVAVLYDRTSRGMDRHLLFHASHQLLRVTQGRKTIAEVPFSDLDRVYVQVVARPSYSDVYKAYVDIGPVALRLTGMVASREDAIETAEAIAAMTGAELEAEPRRRMPD